MARARNARECFQERHAFLSALAFTQLLNDRLELEVGLDVGLLSNILQVVGHDQPRNGRVTGSTTVQENVHVQFEAFLLLLRGHVLEELDVGNVYS